MVVSALAVLAAAEPAFDPITLLQNGGVVGGVLIMVLTRRLHTHGEFEDVVKQRDAAIAREAKLRDSMDAQVIPALTRSTDLLLRQEARNGK